MRVITGTARGRRLREPEGMDIRPTTDKVKESIFNIVQFDIEGRRVLDLFAGTGQLGIEAASRGAESVTFVDSSRNAAKLVRDNLDHCGLRGQVHQADALHFLAGCGRFDLIFVDPPYDSEVYESVLEAILKFDILPEGGIIVCESRREKELPLLSGFRRREYDYGRVKLTVYTKEAE
ncbi:MAG: 16S rRNA (guanine(966)-N(2))-methyltransferase RsmD [Candidatus Heteroscillospira sp.]|jgi:16S rRNA (guanine966-N2)-methyltransferase